MARFTLIFSSICSLFVLSWCLSRWSGPQNCINSTLVGKLIILPGGQTVDHCDPVVRLFADQPPKIVKESQIFRRLEKLEELAPYLDQQGAPITLTIHEQGGRELTMDQATLRLGERSVMEPSILERSLLFMKINNGTPVTSAAVADFLWQEFVSKTRMTPIQPWLTYLSSLKSYCQSDRVLLIHRGFCDTHNELNDSFISDDEGMPVPWGLTVLYTSVLRFLYQSSDLAHKKQLLENIIFLGDPDDLFLDEPIPAGALSSRISSFDKMMMDWLMPLLMPEDTVRGALAKYRMNSNELYNYVMVGRSSRHVFPLDFNGDPEEKLRERPIIQFGVTRYIDPSDVTHRFSREEIFQNFSVKNVIYASCEMPEVESLLEFRDLTQKVIFIKVCHEDDVDWRLLAQRGLSEYLQSHPRSQFIEFNLSALQLAKRLRGPLHDSSNFQSWQKWLLWQSTVLDGSERAAIQRPLSAIDGVGRFRMF